ncbi:MAG: PD-(D/E)XK nuclease family protein [Desulfobacterales bacterium]
MDSFNFFDVLWRRLREEDHDPLLAWLLDPKGNHPFGSAIIDAVINQLYETNLPDDVFNVNQQYALGPSSIPDIALEGDKSLVIVENKVFRASISNEQIERYIDLGYRRAAGRQFFLILMSPLPLEPTQVVSTPPPAFEILSWSVFSRIIEEQQQKTDNSYFISEILNQYRDYIHQTIVYGGGRGSSARHPARFWDEELLLSEAEKAVDTRTFNSIKQIMAYIHSRYDSKYIRFGKGSSIGTFSLTVPHSGKDVLIFNLDHNGTIVPNFIEVRKHFGEEIESTFRAGIERVFGPDPKLQKTYSFLKLQSINTEEMVSDFLLVIDQVFSAIQSENKNI